MQKFFEDRRDAGRTLGIKLKKYRGAKGTIVLALPRGGVPVADEIARALKLPMDLWIVRKLGVPGNEELAMGAIAVGGVAVLNPEVLQHMDVPDNLIEAVGRTERQEIERRNDVYRHGQSAPDVREKTVIVVDDGLATGASMRAAVDSLRAAGAGRIVVAVPVGSSQACHRLRETADEVLCLHLPEPFWGVGQWYEDFSQTRDEEVLDIMARYASPGRIASNGATK